MRENHAKPQPPILTARLTLSDAFLTGRTSQKPASTLPPDGLTAAHRQGCPFPRLLLVLCLLPPALHPNALRFTVQRFNTPSALPRPYATQNNLWPIPPVALPSLPSNGGEGTGEEALFCADLSPAGRPRSPSVAKFLLFFSCASLRSLRLLLLLFLGSTRSHTLGHDSVKSVLSVVNLRTLNPTRSDLKFNRVPFLE